MTLVVLFSAALGSLRPANLLFLDSLIQFQFDPFTCFKPVWSLPSLKTHIQLSSRVSNTALKPTAVGRNIRTLTESLREEAMKEATKPRVKKCPVCAREYSEDDNYCGDDGSLLERISNPRLENTVDITRKSDAGE